MEFIGELTSTTFTRITLDMVLLVHGHNSDNLARRLKYVKNIRDTIKVKYVGYFCMLRFFIKLLLVYHSITYYLHLEFWLVHDICYIVEWTTSHNLEHSRYGHVHRRQKGVHQDIHYNGDNGNIEDGSSCLLLAESKKVSGCKFVNSQNFTICQFEFFWQFENFLKLQFTIFFDNLSVVNVWQLTTSIWKNTYHIIYKLKAHITSGYLVFGHIYFFVFGNSFRSIVTLK